MTGRVMMGFDPAGPAGDTTSLCVISAATWQPASDPTDRLKRDYKPPPVRFIPLAPKNDMKDLWDVIGMLDKDISVTGTALFRQQYESHFDMAQKKPEPPPHSDFNFVEAFEEGMRRYGEDCSMSYVVRNPRDVPPDFLNHWIWGPHGEFTGFARVNAFDALERSYRHAREKTLPVRLEMLPHVKFRSEVIYTRSEDAGIMNYVEDRTDRRRNCITFVRFASYRDYVAWEDVAARDPYGREFRDYPRR